MSRKIFYSLWLMSLAVFAASLFLLTALMYRSLTGEQLKQLRNERELVTRGVELGGKQYLEDLSTADFRITWLKEDGTILYDNYADIAVMENHLERSEIRDALEYGTGESRRRSATLADMEFYVAQRMEDGTIIRLSETVPSIPHLLLRFLAPLSAVIAAALLLSYYLARWVARLIVEPLNSLDPTNPVRYVEDPDYAELRPLLIHLQEQQKQIALDRGEIEQTSLLRQEFTANASHELKSPLHVISGYAELLESGVAREEDTRLFAGKIRSEAQRMTKLVEDIISLSRLDGGGIGLRRELVDLHRLAASALENLKETADEAGVTLTLAPPPENVVLVRGIQPALYSMIYNLCENAVKYNVPGGSVTVRVDTWKKGSARLTVEDTGIGIPEKDQSRIFERFYRVDKSHSKEVGGTGLGLSIVKHAAMTHKARIEVESEEGKGSVFTVLFP